MRVSTGKDVAELASVSLTAVSHVLNNTPGARISPKVRERILTAAAELNYRPNALARNLALQKSHNVGVVVCRSKEYSPSAESSYAFRIMKGIADSMIALEYDMPLFLVGNLGEFDYGRLFREKRVDGLIMLQTVNSDIDLLEKEETKYPILLVGCHYPQTKLNYMDIDNVGGISQAMEHLVGLGHNRIAFLNGQLNLTNFAERLEGYKKALKKHNIEFDSDIVYSDDVEKKAGFECFIRGLLSKKNRPTAILAGNDEIARISILAIKNYGLSVPEDVAVIGFDDDVIAREFNPTLTTVRQPMYEIGKVAATELINHINSGGKQIKKILKTMLIVRESCGAKKMNGKGGGCSERKTVEVLV